ncbi:MAG: hypothetical protein AAGU05_08705, partial [Anaerolineaceae bacterium]
QKVIDGSLHGIARLGVWLGKIFRNRFDVPVVNGAGDAVGKATRDLGGAMKRVQTGKVQQYMLIGLSVISVAAIFFYYIFL